MIQLNHIKTFQSAFSNDERTVALWLSGSFASGRADKYSDVDFKLAIRDEDFDEFFADRVEIVKAIVPFLLTQDFQFGTLRVMHIMTPECDKIDLGMLRYSDISDWPPLTQSAILFDKTGRLGEDLDGNCSKPEMSPEDLSRLVTDFWARAASLVICVGRNEPSLVYFGIALVQVNYLLSLYHSLNGTQKAGAKLLKPLLKAEQIEELESLIPLPDPSLETLAERFIAAVRYVSQRAKQVYASQKRLYPQEIENAVLSYYRRELGHYEKVAKALDAF